MDICIFMAYCQKNTISYTSDFMVHFFSEKRPISLLMAFQSGLLPIFYSFWYQSCIRFQALDQSESKRANLLTKAILGWSFNCHFRIAGWLFDLLISKFHSIYWLLRGWMNASFYFSSYSPPTQTPIRSYWIEPYSHAHKCWWCGFFSIVQGWVIICSF